MRSVHLLLSALVSLSISIAACSSGSTGTGKDTKSDKDETVTDKPVRDESDSGSTTPQTSLVVPVPGVTAGTYLVRARVDGAESLLASDADGHFNAPSVTV